MVNNEIKLKNSISQGDLILKSQAPIQTCLWKVQNYTEFSTVLPLVNFNCPEPNMIQIIEFIFKRNSGILCDLFLGLFFGTYIEEGTYIEGERVLEVPS